MEQELLKLQEELKSLETRIEKALKKDYVVINGLRWDRENTVIDDQEYFNFYEALGVATLNGKRIPTQEEWEELCDLGSTWDSVKKGIWLGKDHELKDASESSIFLPAAGFRYYNNGSVGGLGSYGYYWSSTIYNTNSYSLYFDSTSINPAYYYYRGLGMSVRCVSEI